jgi:GNAT superfamily N-acetyltransferase
MTTPSTHELFLALDATWPPARFIKHSPWLLREGAGGGQRVSAATAMAEVCESDIASAEAGMRVLDQHPLFMLRLGEDALDDWLEARNYEIVDPVAIYLKPLTRDALAVTDAEVRSDWPPDADALDLWAGGGIGPARIAVMARAGGAKTALVLKDGATCSGVAFVAIYKRIAMLHALEVAPSGRRLGFGTRLMNAAAHWATANGAAWLSLMVTRANVPANALYRGLGMTEVGAYHYRRAPKAKS